VKHTTIGCVRFSSAGCSHKRCCSRIEDTTRTGSGSLHASKGHGQIFRRNEIAKTRSASARICIAREISSNGSSTRSSNIAGWRPDTTNSQSTIWRSSSSHQSAFGCAIHPTPRSFCARSRSASRRPPHPFREPRNPGRIDRMRAPLARRTHCRSHREYRKHRRTRGLQRAEGEHDDLIRLPRARPRQGSHRWATSPRNGSGAALRPPGRLVSSAPDAWGGRAVIFQSDRASEVSNGPRAGVVLRWAH
jgi:hypothetical protein